jgi:hypothetical protein
LAASSNYASQRESSRRPFTARVDHHQRSTVCHCVLQCSRTGQLFLIISYIGFCDRSLLAERDIYQGRPYCKFPILKVWPRSARCTYASAPFASPVANGIAKHGCGTVRIGASLRLGNGVNRRRVVTSDRVGVANFQQLSERLSGELQIVRSVGAGDCGRGVRHSIDRSIRPIHGIRQGRRREGGISVSHRGGRRIRGESAPLKAEPVLKRLRVRRCGRQDDGCSRGNGVGKMLVTKL